MTALFLAWAELRRWMRGPVLRPLALVALALIPTLYGCVYLWSNWDPYGRLRHVPAALVVEDRPVQAPGGQRVAAGAELRRQLLRRQEMKWKPVSARRARDGLRDGTYQVVLSVPRSFSADLVSPVTGKGRPHRARLSMRLNDANGFIIGKLAEGLKGRLQAAVDSAAFTRYARDALTRQAKQEQARGGPPPDAKAIAARAEAVGQPVRISVSEENSARVYGRGLAPFFFSIALWVFGLAVFEVVRPLDKRALASRMRPWSVALGGWAAGAVLGVAGALVLYGVADAGLGLDAQNLGGTLGVMILAAAAFTAVGQVVTALWGLGGALVMLVLLMFQLVSCGGLYPIATEPAVFRALNPAMPMTYLVDALRVTLTGGLTWHLWRDVAVLAALLVVFWILAAVVAATRRVWAPGRLHDPLRE